MCKALIEGGQVFRENGSWQWRSTSPIEMPRSIRMAIETRLRGQTEGTQEVLALAAVIGRRFEFDMLQASAEPGARQDEDALIAALEGAEKAQLLYEVGRGGGGTFEFAHALIPATLVAGISGMRRRRLHRRVLAAMQKLRPEDYKTLAHHCLEAGEDEHALDFLLKAGQRARTTFANAEAVANYQQAIGLLKDLHHEPVAEDSWQSTAQQLYQDLGDVLEMTGQHEQAWKAYQNALELLPTSQPIQRSSLFRKACKTRENLRLYDDADQIYQQAETALGQETVGSEVEWRQEWVALQLDRMSLYYWPGRVEEMIVLAEKVRPAVERFGTLMQLGTFYSNLVLAAVRHDRYVISDEILDNVYRAASILKEVGYTPGYTFQEFMVGFCLLWHGDLAEAESHFQLSLQACERAGDVTVEARCLTYLAVTYRKLGDISRVRDYAARSLETATTGQMIEYVSMAQTNQAWALRREGKLEEARRLVETAWETMQKTIQAQMFLWVAVWPLLGISLDQKRIGDAVEFARLLLNPKTQPQPEAIAASLQSAITAWEKGQLEQAYADFTQAASLAEPLGYI
jgi:tetratricopeptide (TPR) repeat protein